MFDSKFSDLIGSIFLFYSRTSRENKFIPHVNRMRLFLNLQVLTSSNIHNVIYFDNEFVKYVFLWSQSGYYWLNFTIANGLREKVNPREIFEVFRCVTNEKILLAIKL